ncbi:MAG: Fic family protein [Chthoniobacterales bacterium]
MRPVGCSRNTKRSCESSLCSGPRLITFEQVLYAHEDSLRRHGGSNGIRDEGLLRSAIHQPQNDFFYGGADRFGIAAAYAYHIAQAQAFLDGNKRTAVTADLVF